MSALKIKDGVYSVGVLNPNLRVFDIVMATEFGTSYNAYLVQGTEKTALIETAHLKFFDYYLSNVTEVCDIAKVDYIVMNHNEPDHSGSIAKLLALNPNITVVASQAGSIYLKNITNTENMKLKTVKDGESLDLGGKTLKFVNAPFLHWPDSMFTYLEQEKLLFSCDFLGAHYCEPQLFDTKMAYPADYEKSFKGYYDAIFAPFKPYVLKGLEKMNALDIETVCTSHGPVLTKGGLLDDAKQRYSQWSTPVPHEQKEIPIFYCSAYGNTGLLADAIASGIREVLPTARVEAFDIITCDMGELGAKLNASDAFLIGSPTLNKDAVPPVWNLLAHVDAVNIQKRPVAVFGSYGWSGEAVPNLTERLRSLKVKLYNDGESFRVVFVPSEKDLAAAKEFGRGFAAQL